MKEQEFTLYWMGCSTPEVVKGTSISNALNNAGYGGGAIGALDFYEKGDTRQKGHFYVDGKWKFFRN